MIEQMRNKAGFTLAELMMSIAIVLILAAIAFPSIFTAQNNMRMVELNNAAQSIANAAQAQMTSMKVSGTWMPVINNDDGTVKYPVAKNASDTDAFYMIASNADGLQGARDNGVLPSLSIDDTVRNGDFVIVFKASTASVIEVFYTDGKSGFFGDAPASTTVAQNYYESGAASTDQTVRMKNDPMIGYYQGTPAGATPEASLMNPVIWVADEGADIGKLCVRDPNLISDPSLGTHTEIVISKETDEGKTYTFTLSGLDKTAKTYQVSISDGSTSGSLENESIYTCVGDAYMIDLDKLASVIKEKSLPDALKNEVSQFQPSDSIKLEAFVSLTGPCIPGSAQAYAKWPEPLSKMTVLVTNPVNKKLKDSEKKSVPSYIDESLYTSPVVTLSDGKGVDSTLFFPAEADDATRTFANNYANSKLVEQNAQAGVQYYSGGWYGFAKAEKAAASLKATVGKYNGHVYQIAELWALDASGSPVRLGYLSENKWTWATESYEQLNNCLQWYASDGSQIDVAVNGTADVEYLVVDPTKANAPEAGPDSLLSKLGLLDKAGSATLYVRTMPKASEVQTYFDENAKAMIGYFPQGKDTSGSRGSGIGIQDENVKKIRIGFESEFGASSSDVSYVVTHAATADSDSSGIGTYFTTKDLRVYYSIAPGLGFNDDLAAADNVVTNAVLWAYKNDVSQPEAYVRQPIDDVSYSPYQSASGGTIWADFELQSNLNYMFCRVLYYQDEDGDPIAAFDNQQYVPYTVQDDLKYATIPEGPERDGYVFAGWEVEGSANDWGEGGTLLSAGKTVGYYDDVLPKGAVTLKALYVRKGIGLMYLEFDADNKVTGNYGFVEVDDASSPKPSLPKDNVIDSWGYYAVAPIGNPESIDAVEISGPVESEARAIQIGNVWYRAQAINSDQGNRKANQTKTLTCKVVATGTTKSAQFTYNLNFAAAVAVGDSASWGGSDESPWIVRHGTQFIGNLRWYDVQKQYIKGHFLQTHDIDLMTFAEDGNKFANIFMGVYDGGSFAIRGFVRETYFYNNGQKQGCSVGASWSSDFQGQGLFPAVQGAVLRNIKLLVDKDATAQAVATRSKAHFGYLVGIAEESTIQNCSISGTGNSVVDLSDVPQNNGVVSLLIGKAHKSEIVECSAESLLATVRYPAKIGNVPVSYGMIAGQLDLCTVSECTVSGVKLTVSWTGKTDTRNLAFGFLFGGGSFAEQANQKDVNVYACSATKSSIELSGEVNENAEFKLGGLAGYASAMNVRKCTVGDLSMTLGSNVKPLEKMRAGQLVGLGTADDNVFNDDNIVMSPVRYRFGTTDSWTEIENQEWKPVSQ